MSAELFESFREWVLKLVGGRTRKSSREGVPIGGAGMLRAGDGRPAAASGEIKATLEPKEFMTEHRSPEASWLNIKQLHEPQPAVVELISTSPI